MYPCHHCNQVFATQKAASSHRRQCKSYRAVPPSAEETTELDEPAFEEAVSGAPAIPSVVDEAHVSGNTPVEPTEMLPPVPTITPDEIAEETEPAEQHDDPDRRLTILANTVPVSMCYSPISDISLPEDDNDKYGLQTDTNANFDCNAWLQSLIPPKPKTKKTVCRATQKMSPEDLQKLYSKSMRKALMKINFTPEIECRVPRTALFDQITEQFRSREVKTPGTLWHPCLEGLDILSTPFREEEIKQALQHTNSAAGPDGWSCKDLAEIREFPRMFVEGLHQIASSGITPDDWRHYNIMMLFKKPDDFKNGQETILKCFRPIALSNVSYKLLTSVLCKRMSRWLETNNGISFGQRAAFSRRGVQENTLIVLEALRQKKTVVYLDLSDAFNSIEHNLILEALRQSKCPDWIVKLVESLYRDCTTIPTNVCGDKLCDPIKVRRGVRQGCPLSALLFNLVLDPLLRCSSTECSFSLGYMDDIALIIEDDSQTATILNKMTTMATKLGLTFNAKKCGIANSAQTPTINDEILPRVTQQRAYEYLGTDAFTTTGRNGNVFQGGLDYCRKNRGL